MSVTSITARMNSDPLRAALRQAIAKAQKAQAAVAEHQAAIERARSLVEASEAKLEAATAAIATAREHDAKRLAEAISSGGSSSARALKQARAAETDAADTLETARSAFATLKADLGDVELASAHAGNAVLTVIAQMLRPVTEQVLERARKTKAEFLVLQRTLVALTAEDDAPPDFADEIQRHIGRRERAAPLDELRTEVLRFCDLGLQASDEEWAVATETAGRWRQARAVLRSDADAPLPEVLPR
jgi:hypothetical protein